MNNVKTYFSLLLLALNAPLPLGVHVPQFGNPWSVTTQGAKNIAKILPLH